MTTSFRPGRAPGIKGWTRWLNRKSTTVAVVAILAAVVSVALVVIGLIVFVRESSPFYWITFALSVTVVTLMLRLRATRRHWRRRF